MKPAFALSLALAAGLVSSPTLSAQETLSPQQAETRLRGCLQSGSAGAPRTGLRAAVVAVRALCKPQIDRVADDRVATATTGLTGDDAESELALRFRAVEADIERSPVVEDAVLTLAPPDEEALTVDSGVTRRRR